MTELFTQVELLYRRSPDHPFKLMPELTRLRDERPLTRMRYPDGHEGWLATGHAEARAVLEHPRFSNRPELHHLPLPGMTEPLPPAVPGDLLGLDAPEHTRYRKLLAGKFTPRRMRQLTERMEHFTTERLDIMAAQQPPVDLMQVYALHMPAQMICELLGVPATDREYFQGLVNGMFVNDGMSAEEAAAALGHAWSGLSAYISELVKAKRVNPTDDVLSDLTTSDLNEEELIGVGTFLLGAGMHTTATVIGMSTFALLIHPDQFALLRDDPALITGAVEELLRYTGIGPGTVRTALEDVRIENQLIQAGQSVTIVMDTANRDPRRFGDADDLDLRRNAAGHLTFVHGVHQCLGQHLARIELRVALSALVTRFPTLRLAIPVDEVPMTTNTNVYTLNQLPVAWDA
ncbi:cytochrome [Actinosynnema sp. ALI-1.44]|uniref:cytochrome P450 n=1 Tax=Actinosynnema sp. ALI-1.44 TaxID=1933779 RepID=UPI00097BD018|nr:cytochrome P450 [Actinosynnema sp. ALI-1.44]ONI88288.1 cytochrome [Actinosynnema sp. ALI-1.44]